MKNNIEFYSHMVTADQHPKFAMLRVKYGWAGEGRFWALNNRIGQADGCMLDISKKYNKASIADGLGFNMEEFDEFIEYLADECELIIHEDGKITTEMIQEVYSKVMAEREYSRNKKRDSGKKSGPIEKGKKQSGKCGGSFGKPENPGGNPGSSPGQTGHGQECSTGNSKSSVGKPESSKMFGRTEQQSKVKKSKVKNIPRRGDNAHAYVRGEFEPVFSKNVPPPSGISFSKKNSRDVTPSGRVSSNSGKDLSEYLHGINRHCQDITKLPKKRKQFNPWKWAQQKIGECAHPGAVMESLQGLVLFWEQAGDPWAYVSDILNRKNGNWNEQDAIAIHTELKNMNPGQLEGLTQGLFKNIA